jgi:archaeosine synthase beta-subunit
MCDLWTSTLAGGTPKGAIPGQIRAALAGLPPARLLKLYNAGSFFDPRAIPPEEDHEIAELVEGFERVIVESHPALVASRCFDFAERLGTGRLEVAMGLETVHPEVLGRLNKGMTLESFRDAAERLRARGIGLRVFVLAGLPWVDRRDQLGWIVQAITFAFTCGAGVVSIIPTRTGNGAMDALEEQRAFAPPELELLEAALAAGLALGQGRVFADLWDLERFSRCELCFPARRERLAAMNRSQRAETDVRCERCGAGA